MTNGNPLPRPLTGPSVLDRHAAYIVATFVAGSTRGDMARSPVTDMKMEPSRKPALRNPKSAGHRWAQRLAGGRQIAGYLF
jgi:hypothetical protein